MIYSYQHDGQTYTINLEVLPDGNYRAVIDGRTLTVQARPLTTGGWRLSVNGQTYITHSAAQGDKRYVQVDNRNYLLTVPGAGSRRRATAGSGDLTAQMPGQVTAVLVQAGEQVERGQTLLVMEAMKMEMRVASPVAGTVKRVLVEVGAVVERGQLLVEVSG